MSIMSDVIEIRPEIAKALANRHPVVALESTLIAHGLPYPHSLETALGSEESVRRSGATPATIGILRGRLVVGMTEAELEAFAKTAGIAKVSRRDIAKVIAGGGDGATTVAATMFAAHRAGISILATGGIGGVHRGGHLSLDISADLIELGRTPIAVVASGAKSILDLPRTLEVLETQGVPVVGYRCDHLPAFYAKSSGLVLEARAECPKSAAALLRTQWDLGLDSGVLIANPPPDGTAIETGLLETWLSQAQEKAESEQVTGKDLTPFLLGQLFALSGGRTLEANIALIQANAMLAAEIARELARDD